LSDPLHELSGVTADQLTELLGLITNTDITELDVTIGSTRLSVRRPSDTSRPASSSARPVLEPSSLAITSPLVGMFHPSVDVGATVEPGQPIGAIEALGMPTSVDAPQSGTVEELLVTDGSPVEYGQPLLIVRRAAQPHET
jgi:acetyl-CoA carboxylase biotin carboxyl carrier protein